MERLVRTLIGGGLALVAISAGVGCRATRDEVPPGKAFRNEGRAAAADRGVEFSTQPRPAPVMAGVPGSESSVSRGSGPIVTPPPGDPFGAPPSGKFGGPGTSGLGTPPPLRPAGGSGALPGAGDGPSPY